MDIFTDTISLVTYVTIALIITIMLMSVLSMIQGSRILIGRGWWKLKIAGVTLYLLCIITALSSAPTGKRFEITLVMSSLFWYAGSGLLMAGSAGILGESKAKTPHRMPELVVVSLMMIILLSNTVIIYLYRPIAGYESTLLLGALFTIAGQAVSILFVYMAMRCYWIYRTKHFLYFPLLAVVMFIASTSNIYSITPIIEPWTITINGAPYDATMFTVLGFYGVAAVAFLLANKKFSEILRPELPTIAKDRSEMPLSEDVVALFSCGDLTHGILGSVLPTIGMENAEKAFNEASSKSEILRRSSINKDGSVDIKGVLEFLEQSEKNRKAEIVADFMKFNIGVLGTYADITSEELAAETTRKAFDSLRGLKTGATTEYDVLFRAGAPVWFDGTSEKDRARCLSAILFEDLFATMLRGCRHEIIADVKTSLKKTKAAALSVSDDGAIKVDTKFSDGFKDAPDIVAAFKEAMGVAYSVLKKHYDQKAIDGIFKQFFESMKGYGRILHKYGILEALPSGLSLHGDVKLGRTYIVEEQKPHAAFRLFNSLLEYGIEGLCITRLHRDIVKDKYGYSGEYRWLTKSAENYAINPTNMVIIAHTIDEFLTKNGNGIILLDGIEYLIANRDFPMVLKMVEDMNDVIMKNKSILIIPANPETFAKKDLEMFKRNMEVIVGGGPGT